MLNKFLDGLYFGTGFALAFVVIALLAGFLIAPMVFSPRMPADITIGHPGPHRGFPMEGGPQFHELSIDEQIKEASVIALARYEPSPDGRMKAVIKEFLKKKPGTELYYDVGDEYPSASYVPEENASRGDGLVIFFVGSPAMMRMSMSYTGNRIYSLGDIPLELFRDKCKDSG